MILDKKEIKNLIPHRKPFLFLDSVKIIESGKKGIGFRKFLSTEYFFEGHFPNMPIVPGVVLIEALAQTAGVVVSKKFEEFKNKSVLFVSITNPKFRNPVYPEDEISFNVEFINELKNFYKFTGTAYKGDTKVCESEFSAVITKS